MYYEYKVELALANTDMDLPEILELSTDELDEIIGF
jgi:hypothetical protein